MITRLAGMTVPHLCAVVSHARSARLMKKPHVQIPVNTYGQYVARLGHLYSVLPKSSTLISCFEIQKQMWAQAVTLRDDCIGLSADRDRNICHEVILEHSNASSHNVEQTQGVVEVTLLGAQGKCNLYCWPCPLDYEFRGQWSNAWEVPNSTKWRMQQPNFCHDHCKNCAKMRQVHHGVVGLCWKITTPQRNNWALFCVVMTVI